MNQFRNPEDFRQQEGQPKHFAKANTFAKSFTMNKDHFRIAFTLRSKVVSSFMRTVTSIESSFHFKVFSELEHYHSDP